MTQDDKALIISAIRDSLAGLDYIEATVAANADSRRAALWRVRAVVEALPVDGDSVAG
jgi:hypothetical protein